MPNRSRRLSRKMPHATTPGPGYYPQIKAEAGSPDNTSNAARHPTSDADIYDASSVGGDTIPVNATFYHKDRSDAPPPSERPTESEPILMEHRIPGRENGIPSPPAEEGFNFQTSFRELGKKLKAYNDTLGELQALGVSHDVPLPELVLVGDQSAGKSSVMSGLANLDLPRSEGTCTRCPLHIRVSRNASESYRVSLQKMYKYAPPDNGEIHERDVTEKDPFFPWRQLPNSVTVEFKTLNDKSELEEVLRWAQIAILNPDKSSDMFVPGCGALAQDVVGEAETTAKFSPNVVFLEIKGPDMPNLSFYDLPGIFQNAKEERDSYTVHVVKNLSESYIRRKSAIIMCSMPMNSDAENSCTFGLVRKLGASHRTVGILTKADLLPTSASSGHDQWLEIMEGRAHSTGLGYFITSRPPRKDLEELSVWEEAMFRTRSLDKWPETFHKFEDRCGVEPLKELISQKLAEEFAKNLPEIEKKVKTHLSKTSRELAGLPDLPRNTELEVKRSLREFSEAARRNIEAFGESFNTLPSDFRNCVIGIHPKFMLKDKSDIPTIDLLDSDDDDSSPDTPTNPAKRRNMAPPETPSKRARSNATPAAHISLKHEDSTNGNSPRATPQPQPQPQPAPSKFAKPFDKFDAVGRGFRTIAEVRNEIEAKARAGMLNRINLDVYSSLALEGLKPIEHPMLAFLHETKSQIGKELVKALRDSFGGLQKRLIFQECQKHLKAFLQKHVADAKQHMDRCYQVEMTKFTTSDRESLQRYEEADHLTLTRYRHKQRMIAYGDLKAQADKEKPLRDWNTMSDGERDAETRKRAAEAQKIGADRFAKELEVISYVRGYYRLAAQRFADNIIQCVECLMIPAMKTELSIYLDEQLGLIGNVPEHVYRQLMEENAETSQRRDTLRREMAKFEQALASIEALKQQDGSEDDIVVDDAAGEV